MSDRRGFLALDERSKATLSEACQYLNALDAIAAQLKASGRATSNFASSVDRVQADLMIMLGEDQRTRRTMLNDDLKKYASPDHEVTRARIPMLGTPLSPGL